MTQSQELPIPAVVVVVAQEILVVAQDIWRGLAAPASSSSATLQQQAHL
jgi:hypothetical protein